MVAASIFMGTMLLLQSSPKANSQIQNVAAAVGIRCQTRLTKVDCQAVRPESSIIRCGREEKRKFTGYHRVRRRLRFRHQIILHAARRTGLHSDPTDLSKHSCNLRKRTRAKNDVDSESTASTNYSSVGAREMCEWFNEDSYIRMRHDYQRVAAYSEAIKRKAKGRTVLDIGTGAEALLAVLCAKAGAKKVYAIEANSVSAEKAKKVVKEEGLEHVISVIEGYSSDIESIPEECDLVVHEIIGEIGSKEGVVATIHDVYKRGMVKGVGSTTRKEAKTNGNHRPFASPVAPPTRAEQRWKNTEEEEEEKEEEEEEEEEIALDYNKLGGGQGNYETMKCSSFASIPMGFRSYIGPVSMPGPHYWESLPIKIIRPPPDCQLLRLNDFPWKQCQLAEPKEFENFNFNAIPELSPHPTTSIKFTIERDGLLAGLAIYVEIDVDADLKISSKSKGTSWANPLLLFPKPFIVAEGDVLELEATVLLDSERVSYVLKCRASSGTLATHWQKTENHHSFSLGKEDQGDDAYSVEHVFRL